MHLGIREVQICGVSRWGNKDVAYSQLQTAHLNAGSMSRDDRYRLHHYITGDFFVVTIQSHFSVQSYEHKHWSKKSTCYFWLVQNTSFYLIYGYSERSFLETISSPSFQVMHLPTAMLVLAVRLRRCSTHVNTPSTIANFHQRVDLYQYIVDDIPPGSPRSD